MSEQDYLKLLERLVKGAEYLENPLITEEDYRKGRKVYDAIEAEILGYQKRLREVNSSDAVGASAGKRSDFPRAS